MGGKCARSAGDQHFGGGDLGGHYEQPTCRWSVAFF